MSTSENREADLEALACQLRVSLESLRTFAAISDPRNAHLFTADAARKDFAGVKVRDVQFDDLQPDPQADDKPLPDGVVEMMTDAEAKEVDHLQEVSEAVAATLSATQSPAFKTVAKALAKDAPFDASFGRFGRR